MDFLRRHVHGRLIHRDRIEIVKDVDTGEMTYNDLLLAERKFTEQMYLLPIETNEIRKNNGSLQQTETWR